MRDAVRGPVPDGEEAGAGAAGPFLIDPQRISHDRLEDEVIIIHLEKGAYFSGSGSSADLWTLLIQGASADQAVRHLAQHYSVDEDTVRPSVERCVRSLVAADILKPALPGVAGTAALSLAVAPKAAWAAPAFDEYTDMWDLIQLDPIHDVDDAGWPYALPQATL